MPWAERSGAEIARHCNTGSMAHRLGAGKKRDLQISRRTFVRRVRHIVETGAPGDERV